ncbi:MAG: acetyl-CoA C-acyltransferase [Candidatus Marinimicrobia bacterium]|nr:acetyl-CoA C-acyltransferase [Candidatus Neomarinimicrobiota bacterium]
MSEVVILDYTRTPIGAFNGLLSNVPVTKLGATVINGLINKTDINPEDINEVIMGNVLSAGVGQAPARQALIYGGLPDSVESTTINKMCGSGLKAIMLSNQILSSGDSAVMIAGGMENMSLSPHIILKSREGNRLGHGKIIDTMINDGLWDVYGQTHMGNCAELCAEKYNFSREEQDAFAVNSYKKSQQAQIDGIFKSEICPVSIKNKKGLETFIDEDEEPNRVSFDKVSSLRPAFDKNGTITAANASTINDGAAAVLLTTSRIAEKLNKKPKARIVAQVSVGQKPEWFTTAPIEAIKKVLNKADLRVEDIDLFEINEAFSVVALAAQKELNIDDSKLNIYGGAVSLGHPIGASGARIMCTLINAMERKKARYGLAAICIGGGEASAMIIERIN